MSQSSWKPSIRAARRKSGALRAEWKPAKEGKRANFLRPHTRDVAIENFDMKKSKHSANPEPTHEEITALAHRIYEEEGCPFGQAEAHWLEAERRLRKQTGRDQNTAVPTPVPPAAAKNWTSRPPQQKPSDRGAASRNARG